MSKNIFLNHKTVTYNFSYSFDRYWIVNFPLHFGVDMNLNETLNQFRNSLERDQEQAGSQLLDLSEISSYDWIRNVSYREPDATRPSRKVSLVFNHLEPDELALHLTFLEHKIMRRITVSLYC